jgi:hypothetical protein
MNEQVRTSGMSLTGTLLVVFVVLKLTDNIDWSWLWVLSPLWIPLGLAAVILLALAPFRIAELVRERRERPF